MIPLVPSEPKTKPDPEEPVTGNPRIEPTFVPPETTARPLTNSQGTTVNGVDSGQSGQTGTTQEFSPEPGNNESYWEYRRRVVSKFMPGPWFPIQYRGG